jgi:hypothetical protein
MTTPAPQSGAPYIQDNAAAKHTVTVEDLGITIGTGTLAKQANGAVTISLGETTVFVAAVPPPPSRKDRTSSPSPLTTANVSQPPGVSPAVTSSAKAAPPKRRS